MNAQGFGTLEGSGTSGCDGPGGLPERHLAGSVLAADRHRASGPGCAVPPGWVRHHRVRRVWDGKREGSDIKEKGSQKAISSWWYFRAEPPADYSGYF